MAAPATSPHAPDGLSPAEAARWTRIGVLSALALLLGYLESFIPIPIPGVKLGLANIPILVALNEHDLNGAFFVGLTKVLATGLLFGNPLTLAYSATGAALAFAMMAPLSLLPTMRLWMVSVVGALSHEAGQLLVAQLLLGTPLVWYGAPLLAVAACITGLFCGIAAERTAALLRDEPAAETRHPHHRQPAQATAPSTKEPAPSPVASLPLGAYLLLVAPVMHARTPGATLGCLVATLAACAAARLSLRDVRGALAPTLPIAFVTLLAQLASNQQGAPLLALGPVALTREALLAAGYMLVRLASISCASMAFVRLVGRGSLARAGRRLLAPMRALGVRTQGPELAFATTVALIALLAEELPQTADGRMLLCRSFWAEELPALARSLYDQAASSRR